MSSGTQNHRSNGNERIVGEVISVWCAEDGGPNGGRIVPQVTSAWRAAEVGGQNRGEDDGGRIVHQVISAWRVQDGGLQSGEMAKNSKNN